MSSHKSINFFAKILSKFLCPDIVINEDEAEKKFDNLKKEPENYKHRFLEFQVESSIKERFATEKNNRVMVAMTFVLVILTTVLAILTLVLAFKKT